MEKIAGVAGIRASDTIRRILKYSMRRVPCVPSHADRNDSGKIVKHMF